MQTAIGNAAGESADIANAMLTTAFNLVIFGGAAVGAFLTTAAARRAPHDHDRALRRRSPGVAASRRRAFPK